MSNNKNIKSPAETTKIDNKNHPPIKTNSINEIGKVPYKGINLENEFEIEENSIVSGKTLHNTDQSGCKKNVPDVEIFGDDLFILLSKASSEKEGWMKSTKAMQAGHGVVVQVTTQQRNTDGSYVIAEALTHVPNVTIVGDEVKGRRLK